MPKRCERRARRIEALELRECPLFHGAVTATLADNPAGLAAIECVRFGDR